MTFRGSLFYPVVPTEDLFVLQSLTDFSFFDVNNPALVMSALARMEILLSNMYAGYIFPRTTQQHLLTKSENEMISSNLAQFNILRFGNYTPHVDLLFALHFAGTGQTARALYTFDMVEMTHPHFWRAHYMHARYLYMLTHESHQSPEILRTYLRALIKVCRKVVSMSAAEFLAAYPNDEPAYSQMEHLIKYAEDAMEKTYAPLPSRKKPALKAVGEKKPTAYDGERFDVLFGRKWKSLCVADAIQPENVEPTREFGF